MPLTVDQIVTLVDKKVPIFKGNESPNEIDLFICRCRNIKKLIGDDQNLENLAINEIKDKFLPDAFHDLEQHPINSIQDIIDYISRKYLPKKSIHDLLLSVTSSKQNPDESIEHFAIKLKGIIHDYSTALKIKYPSTNRDNTDELDDLLKQSFISGIRDTYIKNTLKTQKHLNTDDLIDLANDLDETPNSLENTISSNLICQICDKPGHSGINCRNRYNTINQKSHLPHTPNKFHLQPSNIISQISCNYCKKPGHSINNCHKRARMNNSNFNPNHAFQSQKPTFYSHSKPNYIPNQTNFNSNSRNHMQQSNHIKNSQYYSHPQNHPPFNLSQNQQTQLRNPPNNNTPNNTMQDLTNSMNQMQILHYEQNPSLENTTHNQSENENGSDM